MTNNRSAIDTLANTALLIVDLQNDFLHPEGAYGRAGQSSPHISVLPQIVRPVAQHMRDCGGWVMSTQFTLVPGRDGAPMIDTHLKRLRPFLSKGDFLPGAFGHQLVDVLQPADFCIEKVAYSAFYMTRLEWILRRVGVTTLFVAGIVTNGGVSSTVRDAHVRGFDVCVMADACAAFDQQTHDTAIEALRSVARISTTADVLSELAP